VDAVVIVTACRLEPYKGPTLLLDALGKLRGVSQWHCWVAGGAQRPAEEQFLKALRQQADALGIASRVQFLGQRSDVQALLAAADIHCQPNLGPEPFGIAFIEALYAGLPVVTTALGGALEIVDKDCGVLVNPGDTAALAGELQRLIEDAPLRARLGACGPARAALLCDPVTQFPRLGALLQGIRNA
jgi:glycosyltransferase involved in cell wall biosynthesis